MKIIVINRSNWPDCFVNVMVKWIGHRAGIYKKLRTSNRDYILTLPNTKNKTMFAGRGNGSGCRVRINRRFYPTNGFPYKTKYWRYKWSFTYELMNRLEAFVDIMAHEMCHATDGLPGRWGSNRAGMEMTCERFARDTVLAFREEWPKLKKRVMIAARSSRKPKDDKFLKAQKMLDKWQKKAKIAAAKVAKYKRQVARFQKPEKKAAKGRLNE